LYYNHKINISEIIDLTIGFRKMISDIKKKYGYRYLTDEIRILKVFSQYAAFDKDNKVYRLRLDENTAKLIPPILCFGETNVDVFVSSLDLFREESFYKYAKNYNITSSFLEEVPELIRKHTFDPPHMRRIDDHHVTPYNESLYNLPKYLVDVPLVILEADKYIQRNVGPKAVKCFNVSYCVKGGMPVSVVTGVHSNGLARNLKKMELNKYKIDSSIPDTMLYAGMFMLLKDINAPVRSIEIERPEKNLLIEHIAKYKTSVGIIPLENPVLLRGVKNKLEVIYDKMPTSKSAVKDWVADLIMEYWDMLDKVLEDHDQDRFFPGAIINKSCFKYEIKNGHEVNSIEDLEDLHKKVRLFFIEPVHAVMMSHIALAGLFKFLTMPGFEIGTKLNDGGYKHVWQQHDLNSTDFNRMEGSVYDALYERYPFFRKRASDEADFETYDQSLLFKFLMLVGLTKCMFYIFKMGTCTRTIMGDVVFRLVFKYLYLVPLAMLFIVLGMMFSGKFETSHGNTLYQNLVFMCYIVFKLDQHKYSKQIGYFKIAVDYKLLSRSFSGDDMFRTYPEYIRDTFNFTVDDYAQFVVKLGLRFKYKYVKPLYGVVHSVRTGLGWITTNPVQGVTFLKNQMALVYEDEGKGKGLEYVGLYPFRSTTDLLFRVGNSDKANQYLDSFFAKILSLSYISFGNREAYTYMRVLYLISRKRFKWDGKINIDMMQNIFKGSSVMFYAFNMLAGSTDFPDLQELRNRHDTGVPKNKREIWGFNQIHTHKKFLDSFVMSDLF
jgi:hypothetical protein